MTLTAEVKQPTNQKEPMFEPLERLTRDLKRASATLTETEARYLVDYYYQLQRDRIRASNRIFSVTSDKGTSDREPHDLLKWLQGATRTLESNIKSALDAYSLSKPLGQWARSIPGIGPVITAGLLAHIDITKAQTAGAIWRFAGLDPEMEWEKGQKRPWNSQLKTLCWKIGESFVKVKGREDDVYGGLYIQRREYEEQRNEAGKNKDLAHRLLNAKRYGKATESYKAYSAGKLPKAQIYARSKRWAVKLFLAHYHHVGYELEYGVEPPKPYVIGVLGHKDYIGPPNWPIG